MCLFLKTQRVILERLEIGIEGSNETKVISDSASGVSLNFTEEEQQALSNGDSSNLTTTFILI